MFQLDLGHLFVIRGDPQRAALLVLNVLRKAWSQCLPQTARVASERELRRRVVHYHDLAHSGGRRRATRDRALHDANAEPRFGALQSAG